MLVWMAVAASPAVAAPCPVPGVDAPALVNVSADVWRVPAARGAADATNGGATIQLVLVRDGTRLWLIGSGPTPAFGAALRCEIERVVGGSVTDIVNTRAAPELALGNVAFPSARRWALPDVTAAMRARCGHCLQQLKSQIGAAGDSLRDERIRPPTRAVGQPQQRAGRLGPFSWLALPRRAGERTLVLRHGPLVVAQGLLWADDIPDLRDTRSDVLAASLRRLRASLSGNVLLIGEQGEPVSGVAAGAALDDALDYVEQLRAAVSRQLAQGDALGATGATLALPAFAQRPGYATTHALNVQRVWRELEDELFR